MQPFLRVSSYIGTIYHKLSDYLLDIPIFDVLYPNRFAFTFMAKMNAMMDLHKLFGEIIPEQIYSVSEAARYLAYTDVQYTLISVILKSHYHLRGFPIKRNSYSKEGI